jgi:3-hydroxyacyl-CoA dehydrogenase
MEKVMVIGAGFMGAGIAQVCAQSGRPVFLCDVSANALERAIKGIRWSLWRLSEKGGLAEPLSRVMDRISPRSDIQDAAWADWIIEAAPEELELKKEIFRKVDATAPQGAVIASNTSSIPISLLADATNRPQDIVGLHFFGPVPLMALVEVVKGRKTSEAVFERAVCFVKALGKKPARVKRDIPGFVMNRIFTAAFREALELLEKGIATAEDIDMGMKEGYGWRAGPFEIADNAGLDTLDLISKAMERLGEGHLSPKGDLIGRMVAEGRLGRKAGRGFYLYDREGKRTYSGDRQ